MILPSPQLLPYPIPIIGVSGILVTVSNAMLSAGNQKNQTAL